MTYKIALVGEAFGENEERTRIPFSGAAGFELNRMLEEAGIKRIECFITNTFNLRPEKNDITTLCTTKKEDTLGLPPLASGKYLRAEYAPELERLYRELRDTPTNLIVALGSTASWALLHSTSISKIRGTVTESVILRGRKVLPVYHPAAILRQWDLRAVTVLDLIKAKRESEFPEIRRPERTVYIEPTLEDLHFFYDNFLANAQWISFDIETMGDQITCIGFAPTPRVAIVVPFTDPRREGGSYWPSLEAERAAWDWVRKVLAHPSRKVGQNVLYDVSFLWRRYGIAVTNLTDDTMLAHHALQPESLKGLGFLGSIYTSEASWKMMRTRGKTTLKRDDE